MEKLPENHCIILFACGHAENKPCMHYKSDKDKCIHLFKDYQCSSTLARVNVITLKLKELMG